MKQTSTDAAPAAAMPANAMNFKVSGRGDTAVIFVHGFGCSLSDWDAQVERLSQRFTCVALDMPGHGLSVVPTSHSMLALRDGARQVMDQVPAERYVLVGHSLGTRVINDVYLQSPQKIAGLAFVDGRYYEGDGEDVVKRMAGFVDADGFVPFMRRAFNGMFTDRADPQLRERLTARAMTLDPTFGRAILLESVLWDATLGRQKFAAIKVPVLLLQSSNITADRRLISMRPGMRTPYMDTIAELVADADVKIVPDVGHFAPLEAPTMVSDELEAFIDRVSASR